MSWASPNKWSGPANWRYITNGLPKRETLWFMTMMVLPCFCSASGNEQQDGVLKWTKMRTCRNKSNRNKTIQKAWDLMLRVSLSTVHHFGASIFPLKVFPQNFCELRWDAEMRSRINSTGTKRSNQRVPDLSRAKGETLEHYALLNIVEHYALLNIIVQHCWTLKQFCAKAQWKHFCDSRQITQLRNETLSLC